MQLTDLQKEIMLSNSNNIVIGGPGTGKTTIILAKAKQLINSGVKPEHIAIACFNPIIVQQFKMLLEKTIGADAKRINYGTLKDLAEVELKATNSLEGKYADDAQMRRLIHQVRVSSKFKGSLHEAEQIVKMFKSRAKKPQEGEEFYEIFAKYQELLTARGWYDRYDCLRQHLIAIRNNVAQPIRAKHLIIDSAQDLNYIQVLWSLEHANVGVKVSLFVDDDQCLYQRAGAIGSKVIDIVTECEVPFKKYVLNESFRVTKNLSELAYKVVSLADQRYLKGEFSPRTLESNVQIKEYNSKKQEMDALVANLKMMFKKDIKPRVAIMARNSEDVRFINKSLVDAGISAEDLSKSVWDMPAAIVVLDLLEVLLGSAEDRHLKNVLSAMGLKSETVSALFAKGVQSHGWLQSGAKLDKAVITDVEEVKKLTRIQTILTSYYRLRTTLSIKDIFKSLCFELMKDMSAHDKIDALVAIAKVLHFRGDLKQNIEKIRGGRKIRLNYPIMIGPAREFRGFEFDAVFLPFCHKDNYPFDYKVLGRKNSNDRRLFFTAMTRSKGDVYISFSEGAPSTYVKAMLGN